MKRKITYKSKN